MGRLDHDTLTFGGLAFFLTIWIGGCSAVLMGAFQ